MGLITAVRKDRQTKTAAKEAVRQRTLKKAVSLTGIGLHSGAEVTLTLNPAPADHGIHFHRTDVTAGASDKAAVAARWDRVADTRLCSALANDHGVTIGTVEHLMAALAGCGIDNLRIELDGPEVPVMDGSAQQFVDVIRAAGVVELSAARRVIRVLKPVAVESEQGRAELAPAAVFSVDFEIEFQSRAIRRQHLRLGVVNGAFCKELANARTFGFMHEVEAMQKAGLARGGSLDNAIVIDGDKVLNDGGLRHVDEFVRHKALDAVGDLYLAGSQIIGAYRAERAGHAINNALLRKLFADPDAWCYDVLRGDESKTAMDGGIKAEAAVV
ncbi:MAG: UDP-3-O-[3-hydroxymyristoyl] N-acetylglucosamine deacetylase [Rhodospirillales bacterium CG15_BIG_FIL_POST_REV_8_21_14_020_66_15]|nr:MAG: UDP-3-O-[3-hydroxymyristoyl] N-acetylglucosamine deacetylase [Rhodospirillales bacterium CG15_BIG_FIL_POST_REV_8_21_14_020_66_15]